MNDQSKDRINREPKEIEFEVIELLPKSMDDRIKEAIENKKDVIDELTGQGRR